MTKLDKVWKNCLRMWKWIIEQIDEGVAWDIHSLKTDFLGSHRFTKPLTENCFFCQYDEDYINCDVNEKVCSKCPGRLVNPKFSCFNHRYHYSTKPRLFYKELLRLNDLRNTTPKSKKKKK